MLTYEQLEQALARDELTAQRTRMRARRKRSSERVQARAQSRARTLQLRSQRITKAMGVFPS